MPIPTDCEGETMPILVPFEYTTENADRCARGEMTSYWGGRPNSRKLTKTQLAEYEAAKGRHYLVAPRSAFWLFNAYYLWCQCANVPFVQVGRRRNYAEVFMDVICCAPHYDLHPEAVHELRAVVFRESVPPYSFSAGVSSHSSRIRLDRAEAVAATFWAIATSPRIWDTPA